MLYFVSNISDKKVYEGHDWYCGAVDALAATLGYPVKHGEFISEDDCDGCTPDRFKDIKGGVKLHGTTTEIQDTKDSS